MKAAREKKQVTYKGNLICLTPDFSAETLQARRDWQDIFKVLKGKNLQPRLQYQARISFKIDGRNKKLFRQAKVRRIQYHQISFTVNGKGRKEKPTTRNKKIMKLLELKKGMATHSSILAWRIPWTEEHGRATVHGLAESQTQLSNFHFSETRKLQNY